MKKKSKSVSHSNQGSNSKFAISSNVVISSKSFSPSKSAMAGEIIRCDWCGSSEIMCAYHDAEWGVPTHDDARQFEFLVLESAQAGLSWLTILSRRDGYRKAFANFDPVVVATFTDKDIARLMQDNGIIRNKAKITAAINNARIFLDLAAKHGSFSNWLWKFVGYHPIVNKWKSSAEVPANTSLSDRIAKEMKGLGFKFLGSTILYSHMQASGLINDHLVDCFRHAKLT